MSQREMNMPSQKTPASEHGFPIVGIGASAGGLAAFEAFFSGMPADRDPDMDGYKLFHLLRERNPGLPFLITSGYGDAVVSSRIEAGETVGLLSKPYSLDQLRDALKRVVKVRNGTCEVLP